MNLLIIAISIVAFLLSFLITPFVAKYMKKIGKVGIDVHKAKSYEVPESGGIGFMFLYVIIIIGGIFIAHDLVTKYRLIIMAIILFMVTLIGLYDDFKRLSALLKPLLLIIPALLVFFTKNINGLLIADPTPLLPFVGETSLKIVYWGLAIFVVAIPSNASNMLDVMNGVMSGSGIIISLTAFAATFIVPLSEDAKFVGQYASLTLTAVLFGFWLHNRYPAKTFAGDTGSLGTGAALGLIAIYAEIEFVIVIALLVHIMNSFSILGSIKGLKERHEIKKRPVYVENGVIHASTDPKAPITLVRLLVARKPLTEPEIIREIIMLVIYSSILAIISAFLMRSSI